MLTSIPHSLQSQYLLELENLKYLIGFSLMMRLMRLTSILPLLEFWEMMFLTDFLVSCQELVFRALEGVVQLLSELRIMMVRLCSNWFWFVW